MSTPVDQIMELEAYMGRPVLKTVTVDYRALHTLLTACMANECAVAELIERRGKFTNPIDTLIDQVWAQQEAHDKLVAVHDELHRQE
jgi:hypothetical protein